MCLSKPNIPAAVPVTPLQEAKPAGPLASAAGRKVGQGMTGGTLLTSPSGITRSALVSATPTLLGG